MTSASLSRWRTARAVRLDELLAAHQLVGGATAGRRLATGELNRSLVLRLAAQFQGFARDLHGEASLAFGALAQPKSPEIAQMIGAGFQASRELDRRNANQQTLSNDFARLGVDLWTALGIRDRRTPRRRHQLQWLNVARNGLAHDDEAKVAKVVAAGFPLNLSTIRQWRSAADGLAGTMDVVLADHLAPTLPAKSTMVGSSDMSKFRNGDHVIAAWGFVEREGVVVDSFGPSDDPFVTVRTTDEFPESDEPPIRNETLFKASMLRHVDNEAVA